MLILGLAPLGSAAAQTVEVTKQPIIITEVMVGTAMSATQEFIELFNVSPESVSLEGWQVQYLSSANNDWSKATRTITLSGVIEPDAYLLIASNDYLPEAPIHFASTLAQSGGHVRVLNSLNTNQYEVVGWGMAAAPLLSAAPAPKAGQSIMRVLDAQSQYVTATNNSLDFILSDAPAPGLENTMPAPEISFKEAETVEEQEVGNEDLEPVDWPDLRITELLPNPEAPALDSEAEFVELYNASNEEVNLTGYTIKTGSKLSYSFTLGEQIIKPGEYLALTSAQTSLTLSNTSGKAVLYAPDATQLFETKPYEKAANGQSWILNGDNWAWTTEPTQGFENILSAPALALALSLPKTKTTTPKKATSKSTKSATQKKAKTTKPKFSAKSNTDTDTVAAATSSQKPTRPMHPLVLAGIGSVVVLYALYEYRHDMANKLHQLRANRAARRATSQTSTPAGSH